MQELNRPSRRAFLAGKRRVFHTTLGHDARAIRMPGAADLIRRGAAWAAIGGSVAPPSAPKP